MGKTEKLDFNKSEEYTNLPLFSSKPDFTKVECLKHIYEFDRDVLEKLNCPENTINYLVRVKDDGFFANGFEYVQRIAMVKYYILSNNYDIQKYNTKETADFMRKYIDKFDRKNEEKCIGLEHSITNDIKVFNMLTDALDRGINIDFICADAPIAEHIIKLILLMLEYKIDLWDYTCVKYSTSQLKQIELGLKNGLGDKIKLYMKVERAKDGKIKAVYNPQQMHGMMLDLLTNNEEFCNNILNYNNKQLKLFNEFVSLGGEVTEYNKNSTTVELYIFNILLKHGYKDLDIEYIKDALYPRRTIYSYTDRLIELLNLADIGIVISKEDEDKFLPIIYSFDKLRVLRLGYKIGVDLTEYLLNSNYGYYIYLLCKRNIEIPENINEYSEDDLFNLLDRKIYNSILDNKRDLMDSGFDIYQIRQLALMHFSGFKVDPIDYKYYDSLQIAAIRRALEDDIDILPLIDKKVSDISIDLIRYSIQRKIDYKKFMCQPYSDGVRELIFELQLLGYDVNPITKYCYKFNQLETAYYDLKYNNYSSKNAYKYLHPDLYDTEILGIYNRESRRNNGIGNLYKHYCADKECAFKITYHLNTLCPEHKYTESYNKCNDIIEYLLAVGDPILRDNDFRGNYYHGIYESVHGIKIPEEYEDTKNKKYCDIIDNNIKKVGYPGKAYDIYQRKQIVEGLQAGLKVKKYSNPIYSASQMEQLKLGLIHNIPLDYFSNPHLYCFQMEEIRLGVEHGIDVSTYASPLNHHLKMRKFRKLIESSDNEWFIDFYNNANRGVQWMIEKDYKNGIDVRLYMVDNESRMEDIRWGLLNKKDVLCYRNIKEWKERHEIMDKLESGKCEYSNLTSVQPKIEVVKYSSMFPKKRKQNNKLGRAKGIDSI